MALADYRLCDVCGGKAFYDADLNYDDEPPFEGQEPYKIAGQASSKSMGYRIDRLGDWAVICHDCAKSYKTQIMPREP